ncbi:MAG: Type 1 glutamine amidotransferase-like domain-containing protein [Candidatus Krumholzibacteria bacterium]|nr:Type 1 glutamine amidotransferase-like domain-containing protein [Candidatus Krumholzibacteria bacterium]
MQRANERAPIYLLAGGPGSRRSQRDPVLERAIASCGVAEPSIAYIGAASGDDKSFFKTVSGYVRSCGAGDIKLAPLVGGRIKLDKTRSILESADAVFVSGGDVEEGMEAIEERRMMPFLRELFEGGKPFIGLSAGSIMLAREWIVWDDPNDDATSSTFACMALAQILCDTHSEYEGWEELRALLLLNPEGSLGYGIPGGAGLCVYPDGTLEALGCSVHCLAKVSGAVKRREDIQPR